MTIAIDPSGPPDAAPPYPARRYAAWVLGVFFLAAVLSYTDRLILNILVDPIRRDLGIGDTQVSLLQGAAFAVLYAFMGLPLGRFADRRNRRNLALAGVVTWTAATVACALSRDFSGLFAARICVGLGEAALAPAVMSMIPDYFPPERRGAAIGVFLTGMSMGGGVATVVGGSLLTAFSHGAIAAVPLIGHLAPWRAVVLALSAPGALIAALMLTVREPARQNSLAAAGLGADAGFRRTLDYFAANRLTFGLLFTAFALGNLVAYGGDSWLPTVFIRRFGQSPAQVGLSIGLVSLLLGAAGTILGGVISDRMQRSGRADAKLRFTLVASLIALPLLAFPLAPSPASALAAYGAYTAIAAMASTAGLTAVQDAVPSEMRGFAVAIQAFMYTLIGLGIGPTAVALATERLYRAPQAVGLSIVTVALPVSSTAAVLVWRALGAYRRTWTRLNEAEA